MPTPIRLSRKKLIASLIKVLCQDHRVIFAYLYGSFLLDGKGNDIDIAVLSDGQCDEHLLSADLKIALYKETGISSDDFDIRIINEILEKGNIFALLYLKNVLEQGKVIVDKAFAVRSEFLERYGMKFRECEGLIQEVLS